MFSVNLREDIKDAFWRECGNIEFRYISSVVLEDFLRYMITRHFRSYGYKDEGKMYHFALARSTRREKKDLRFDCDECSFFRLYHIKCEESKSRFWNIVLRGEKKGITLSILFLLCCGYIKNVIMICVYQESSPHLLHNWSVLVAHDKHADRWLDCVFTFTRLWKKMSAFPFALVCVKKRWRLFFHVEHDENWTKD